MLFYQKKRCTRKITAPCIMAVHGGSFQRTKHLIGRYRSWWPYLKVEGYQGDGDGLVDKSAFSQYFAEAQATTSYEGLYNFTTTFIFTFEIQWSRRDTLQESFSILSLILRGYGVVPWQSSTLIFSLFMYFFAFTAFNGVDVYLTSYMFALQLISYIATMLLFMYVMHT